MSESISQMTKSNRCLLDDGFCSHDESMVVMVTPLFPYFPTEDPVETVLSLPYGS